MAPDTSSSGQLARLPPLRINQQPAPAALHQEIRRCADVKRGDHVIDVPAHSNANILLIVLEYDIVGTADIIHKQHFHQEVMELVVVIGARNHRKAVFTRVDVHELHHRDAVAYGVVAETKTEQGAIEPGSLLEERRLDQDRETYRKKAKRIPA